MELNLEAPLDDVGSATSDDPFNNGFWKDFRNEKMRTSKFQFVRVSFLTILGVLLAVCSPQDLENRVRGELLHILVVGELQGMRKIRT